MRTFLDNIEADSREISSCLLSLTSLRMLSAIIIIIIIIIPIIIIINIIIITSLRMLSADPDLPNL